MVNLSALSVSSPVLIVVNYQKSELTINLLSTLAGTEGAAGIHVIVIDNGSTAQSQAALKSLESERTIVVYESENWGYFGAAKRGLKRIRELGLTPAWVIISNSDIEFTQPKFFTKLASQPADVGVLAPRVLSGLSGNDQNPYMVHRPTSSKMIFLKRIFRYRITCFVYQLMGLGKSLLKKKLSAPVAPSEQKIYAAHGSFLIFSRRYFALGGSFDHKPFLFGEEITVAETCRRLKLEIRYVPDLSVSHIEHATMGWIPSAKTLAFQREASEYCADTYFTNELSIGE